LLIWQWLAWARLVLVWLRFASGFWLGRRLGMERLVLGVAVAGEGAAGTGRVGKVVAGMAAASTGADTASGSRTATRVLWHNRRRR
jgi:hypothetical protein